MKRLLKTIVLGSLACASFASHADITRNYDAYLRPGQSISLRELLGLNSRYCG